MTVRHHTSPPKLTLQDAMTAPTEHAFLPGHGYVRLGPPMQIFAPLKQVQTASAAPPSGTKNGTRHTLRAPTGGLLMIFTWNSGCWFRPNGNRVAWTSEHLAASGWSYVGPTRDH